MFIIGRGGVTTGNKSDLDTSIQYFERSLKIDPDFAPGYAGLAVAYDFYAIAISPDEAWPKAKEAALKAISLDDSVADAYFVLADMKTCYEWDWEGGEKAWKRALDLNPNNAFAHVLYGGFLVGQGRNQEAIFHAERALELDPYTYTTVNYVKIIYRFSRQYDRAIAVGKESLRLFPNDPGIYMLLSLDYLFNGLSKEGIAAYQKAIELGLPLDSPFVPFIYALSGNKSKARDAINGLLKQAKEKYVNPHLIARAYALLGEKDKAFEWLEKSYKQRNPNIYVLKAEPFFDNLHSDPRFTALLKKMGLEK